MGVFINIALFGWIPVVFALFAFMPPRRAVVVAFVTAWLFLPMASFPLKGFPDWTKVTATTTLVFAAAAVFDSSRLFRWRPSLIDLPMLVFVFWVLPSTIMNGLGVYEGMSSVVTNVVIWLFPYWIGRVYFNDLIGLRELAIGIFAGGIIYVPLCLFEIRFSPQLHRMVYGVAQHSFAQTMRFGGFRPVVFMQHGLAVGLWMAAASLVGIWLWKSGTIKSLWHIPMNLLVPAILATTVLCKSSGTLALLAVGTAVLFISQWINTRLIFLILALSPIFYMVVRSGGEWGGSQAVNFTRSLLGDDRADSLRVRFKNEDLLVGRAKQALVFGWSGRGRALVHDSDGRIVSTPDGFWVIMLGTGGLTTLAAITISILLPTIMLCRQVPPREWSNPMIAPAIAIAMLLVLYMIDNLMNAMINPIYVLAMGGLAGMMTLARRAGRAASASAGRTAHPPGLQLRHGM